MKMKLTIFALLLACTVAEQAIDANYHTSQCMKGEAYKNDRRIPSVYAASVSNHDSRYRKEMVTDNSWYGADHAGQCLGNAHLCNTMRIWASYAPGTSHGGGSQWLIFQLPSSYTIDEVMIDHWGT